jgi:NADH-ubiquinone oxidoreductase chain 5
MVFACGLSNYSVGVFHLANHAFFKALLFLGAGSVIHAVADEQDMRKMGGLKPLVPFTYSMMFIGSLALAKFPFLTGFYSKDLILEVSYGKYTSTGHFCYYLGTVSAFLTAFYSTRLIYLTFLTKPNEYKFVTQTAFDSSIQICVALSCLAIPSIFYWFLYKRYVSRFR